MIRARTERLILRDVTPADAPFILELMNDPGWLQNIGDRGVRSVEQAEAYIKDKIIKQYVKNGFGMYCVVMRDGEEQKLLGQCGLVKRGALEHVDLGFAFLQEYCGKGYGTEAALAVKDLALNVFHLDELVAITTVDNVASQKVLEKIGLRYVDTRELVGIEGVSRYYRLDIQKKE